MTIILGMVGKIEQAPERWFREGLTMIRRNGTQLLQLINQILDLSKLDAGIMPVHLIQGDVVAYLRLLTGSFASYAEAEGKTLYFDPAMKQLMMDFDEQKLKDVVSNLLSNAIKFTPLGGTICLRLVEAPNQQIMIMVEDNGYGIADEKLPHIFDRFYQGDDPVTRRAEGTGIGLALTHELVRLMGGTIQVESQLGKGSIFTVVLSIHASAPLRENQAKIIPSITTPKTRKLETNREEDPELPLLLIVEDNENVVQYLKICLEEQYRVSIARNGQLGIDQALEQIPDLIISDVMMPERDGFDLCKTLKSDMRTSHIPIILLTARADMNSRIEGLEGGADAYLTKPFHEQELEVSLRKALDLRKRLREYYGGKMPLVSESTTSPFAKEDVLSGPSKRLSNRITKKKPSRSRKLLRQCI
ncbi:MAG: response regulator [Haliscomenobacter sp.]|nr:ATP-binding protein [Haliscomenobacter sp.]MBK9488321.1 response regulator [Haliscomenobacter sp.]